MIDFILSRLYFIIIPLVVIVEGFLYLCLQLSEVVEKCAFAKEFIDKFKQYLQSQGKNGDAYGWMTFHSIKMQKDLGIHGIAVGYKPPGAYCLINNYPIIINMLPELHRTLRDQLLSSITDSIAYEYAQTIEEVLIRHMGVLNEQSELLRRQLKNPIIYFREGVQLVLFIPFYLINWLDILSTDKLHGLVNKPVTKFFSGVVSLIAILASLVGLVVDWSNFWGIAKHYTIGLLNKF